jgi:hypothetical protein
MKSRINLIDGAPFLPKVWAYPLSGLHMRRIFHVLLYLVFCAGTAVFAKSKIIETAKQATTDILPTTGCSAVITTNRPRVYVANFFVTYGKKDMGQAIGDYIADRFKTDGRFDLVDRASIDGKMKSFLKNRKLKPQAYLQKTIDLASAEKADCVIFGRISKKKNKVSFEVRMSAVTTGASLRKVDTDVEREEALKFLEGIGESFVSYFVTTKPATATDVVKEIPKSKDRSFYLGLNALGYLPVGSDTYSAVWATGTSLEFGVKGLFHRNLLFGINGEGLYYLNGTSGYAGVYAVSGFGLVGFEYFTRGKFHLQAVLYGGSQFGQASGSIGTMDSWYGVGMVGNRFLFDLGKHFALSAELRYIITFPGGTTVSGVGLALGAQARF